MIVLAIICTLIAAVANAIMDKLQFHYKRSVFLRFDPQWWNPAISWKNKYRDRNPGAGPRFPGATTWLSWATDAWHFFQTIYLSAWQANVAILLMHLLDWPWWGGVVAFFVLKGFFGSVFTLFFHRVFHRKNEYPAKTKN